MIETIQGAIMQWFKSEPLPEVDNFYITIGGSLICLVALGVAGAGALGEVSGYQNSYELDSLSLFAQGLFAHSLRMFAWLMIYPLTKFAVSVIFILYKYRKIKRTHAMSAL